ncbi:MAG: hypothetical protein S4CHLAM2_12890 [Chlamydiales bacterium]|nr:hypothetical protein [Chlamydiales bacterium]
MMRIAEGLKECGLTVAAPARAAAEGVWNHKVALAVTVVALAVLVLCCVFIPGGAMHTFRASVIEGLQAFGSFLSTPLHSGLIFGGVGGVGALAYLAVGVSMRRNETEDAWTEPYRNQVFKMIEEEEVK